MDFSKKTDEELVVLSKENEEAMNVLIERYRNYVKSVSRGYFLTSGDLDDLIQVGTIGVFKAISTYNGTSSFKSYAYRCIKTSIFTAIKNSNSKKHSPLNNYVSLSSLDLDDNDGDKNLIVMDSNYNPEKTLVDNEAESELKEKIKNALTSLEYEILMLYLQGFSYLLISEKINKNPKSIDNAIQRIRKKLLSLKG